MQSMLFSEDMGSGVAFDRGDLSMPLEVETALACTADAWSRPFEHLPVLVRFRASGALRAWQVVLESVEKGPRAAAALSTSSVPVIKAEHALRAAVCPRIRMRAGVEASRAVRPSADRIDSLIRFSTHALCFWLRGGALYEPTLALGALLGGSDIAKDLPFQYIVPPAAAVCVLPPVQQRHHCADASSIVVFAHGSGAGDEEEARPEWTPDLLARLGIAAGDADEGTVLRELTLLSFHSSAGGAATRLILPIRDESDLLCTAVQNAVPTAFDAVEGRFADPAAVRARYDAWEPMLDYLAKVLLYLQLDQPLLRHSPDYTAAPRQFPELGRRKRELRLQQVEQLYDRYIVGPESLSETLDDRLGGCGPDGHELPAHWRRGHFRLQPHGPKASLRKVLFIPPTVVRADRLGLA